MKILLHIPHQAQAATWQKAFAETLPHADIRLWKEGDDEAADYMALWKPPIELLRPRAELKAMFNLGAGVDAIWKQNQATLPAPLIRLVDAGMAEQMRNYILHATLHYLYDFDVYNKQQAQSIWHADSRSHQHPLPLARQQRIGIIGCGALGGFVLQQLHQLGFDVHGYARHAKPALQAQGIPISVGEQNWIHFLNNTRILVNLAPLTPATQGFLNADVFAQLQYGAALINVARGGQVVDADLLAALDSGQLRGATLDVFAVEPLPTQHPFWHHPKIRITPHIAAVTQIHDSVQQVAQNIHAIEQGTQPHQLAGFVDPARQY